MTYAEFVARLQTMLATSGEDADLAAIMPAIIEAAELRCYRDLDPLALRKRASLATVAATATLAGLPADFWIPRNIALAGPPRQRLDRRAWSFLEAYAPDPTATGTPRYWAMQDGAVPVLAPTPAGVLAVSLDYIARPIPLSATNTATWLAANYADLMLYAAMIFAAGYNKSYGAGGDPQQSPYWTGEYSTALAAARIEEAKKKGLAPGELPPTAPPSSGTPT